MRFFKYICLISTVLLISGCENFSSRDVPPARIFMSSLNPSHVLYAASYVGLQESRDRSQLRTLVGVDPVRTEWCAAFLNAILERQGIPGSDSVSDYPLMARSFLEWGTSVDTPQRGDIMVFRRGNSNWQGHVAFYIGTIERNGKTYYRILGGNQNDSVNITEYPADHLIDIRRMNNPLQQRQGVILALR